LKRVSHSQRISIVFLILFFGCDYKPASYGDFEKIVVFADSTLYNQVQTELEQTFDQFLYTPHSEKSFYLDLQPLALIDTYQTRRNLLFIGLIDGKDQVSEFINSALSPQIKERVVTGDIFEIFQENLFSSEQEVIFLPAVSAQMLRKHLTERKDIIFDRLDKSYMRRMKNAMYLMGEQVYIEEYLSEEYGWKIRVQHDYRIVKEADDKSFVWFRRLNPDRNLFIYRFPYRKLDVEGNWLYSIRDSLTTVHFEADSIDKEDTYLRLVQFHGKETIKLTGIWQNHQHYLGGPFRTYAFADSTETYMYLIDMSVTAPGERKKPYLEQLDIMANTFQFVDRKNTPSR
jgi:hypothetical protein